MGAGMNKQDAADEIEAIFDQFNAIITSSTNAEFAALAKGKLFELYVLSQVLTDLHGRGCGIRFRGSSLKFKAAPGLIKLSDPHFEVIPPDGRVLRIFVDIEFSTLGAQRGTSTDDSCTHELDIVLTDVVDGYPIHSQIWLGVECKSTAKFNKALVKAVLGVRRELGFLSRIQPSWLSAVGAGSVMVPASNPSAEFWLAYLDPKGDDYRQSPAAFGIEFRHFAL